MGCASSKIETEDVKRCKARKHFLKQAVAHRHAFAAAHASYIQSLKSTGAAIRQFADVEVPQEGQPLAPASLQLPQTTAKPPPPLPPDKPRLQDPSQDPFSGPYITPLPRAHSMPPLVIKSLGGSPSKSSQVLHPQAVDEDEEEEFDEAQGYSQHKPTQSEPLFHIFGHIRVPEPEIEDFEVERPTVERTGDGDDDDDGLGDEGGYEGPVPVPDPEKVVEEKAVFERDRRKQPHTPTPIQQRVGKSDKDLGTLLRLLDDFFLKSYEAGREVSLLLEAPREYHHEPFVDEKYGIKEHNKKVSHILTWTRSSTGAFLADDRSPNGNVNLASTLDKLHAWEKKLYDEIKALETTRLELNRRTTQLRHQKERREAAATIEKTKALVKSLQTKHLVEFQAVDAALLEVTKLRDDNLHPQLKNILKALYKMWERMLDCHQKQIPIVEELKTLEATPSIKETSDLCKEITDDLEREVTLWHDSLEKVVTFQEKCVAVLLDWLHLDAKQMESEAVESLESSQKAAAAIPLHDLCQEWADALKQISAEQVLLSLKQFSNILHGMATKQENEIKQKKRKEDIQKEWERKKKTLEAFESKYKEKSTASQEMQESRHPVQEKKALVDLLEKNLEEERQRHAKMCEENSTMMLQSLKDGLPEVLHSILQFSQACVQMYRNLVQLDLPQQ